MEFVFRFMEFTLVINKDLMAFTSVINKDLMAFTSVINKDLMDSIEYSDWYKLIIIGGSDFIALIIIIRYSIASLLACKRRLEIIQKWYFSNIDMFDVLTSKLVFYLLIYNITIKILWILGKSLIFCFSTYIPKSGHRSWKKSVKKMLRLE